MQLYSFPISHIPIHENMFMSFLPYTEMYDSTVSRQETGSDISKGHQDRDLNLRCHASEPGPLGQRVPLALIVK